MTGRAQMNLMILTLPLVAAYLVVGCHKEGSRPESAVSAPANQTTGAPSADVNGSPSTVVLDKGDLKLKYSPRKNRRGVTTRKVGSNEGALQRVISDLNQRIALPFDIEVSFQDCDEPDAYYDPETHQIVMCYETIDEYYKLFSPKIKDKAKLDDAVRGATAATFFHEFGHGLVDAWQIPITGREEDAVDQLSTLVLVNHSPEGEQMAVNGAESFRLYADLDHSKEKILWDEHSLDEQRFYDALCLVYGHDPEKYEYLIENGSLPEERAGMCQEEYDRVRRSWETLLSQYLKLSPKS